MKYEPEEIRNCLTEAIGKKVEIVLRDKCCMEDKEFDIKSYTFDDVKIYVDIIVKDDFVEATPLKCMKEYFKSEFIGIAINGKKLILEFVFDDEEQKKLLFNKIF